MRNTYSQRSQLYSLKHIGIEEPYIESLTSYLIRLSEAHQVYPSSLISYVIAPILNKEFLIYSTARGNRFYDGAKTMNGFGGNALDMVGALEQLTKVQQLGILTFASIKEVIPLRYLLKSILHGVQYAMKNNLILGMPFIIFCCGALKWLIHVQSIGVSWKPSVFMS